MTAVAKVPDTAERHRENLTLFVLSEVLAERRRQHSRWGQQNLPDGTGPGRLRELADTGCSADAARGQYERRSREGRLTWADVDWEETAESYDETDEDKLRAELVQRAAVIVAWIECIDRRKRGGA